MLLLFGLSTRDRVVATLLLTCEVCGYNASQALVRRTTRFTLFFVPLFPVRPSRFHLECSHCGALRPLDSDAAGRLATYARRPFAIPEGPPDAAGQQRPHLPQNG